MLRYSSIPTKDYQVESKDLTNDIFTPGFTTTKYPEISVEISDIYVYTTRGDRYDILALQYYNDSSLWWIIAQANTLTQTPNSIIPEIGVQLRIPSADRVTRIISNFESLNR